ncbi:MAG: hypothetical protein LUF32_06830 [Clostridiales bacterium]|nr:hypothetical protein [Clostridiales bacterium]
MDEIASVVVTIGKSTDEILVGDWDGDGCDSLALRRGDLYFFQESIAEDTPYATVTYGRATDEVYAGVWK